MPRAVGEAVLGVDVGATLAKLAVRADGRTRYASHPARALGVVCAEIEASAPARVGLTGGGAPDVAERLGLPEARLARVDEFRAWARGAASLVREQGGDADGPHLVVSLGTGTSVLLVDGERVSRVGGTALGGGTLVGLGTALLGVGRFDELCRLAAVGDRSRVDLRVSDIYRRSDLPLVGDLTAASFGKLALDGEAETAPEDVAAALMGLVGENVALICGGLAAASGARRVLYGGSTLHGNPALGDVLLYVSRLAGMDPALLERGEYAGARGALEGAAA